MATTIVSMQGNSIQQSLPHAVSSRQRLHYFGGPETRRHAVCTLALPQDGERSLLPSQRSILVTSLPPPRSAAPPPEPMPVQHSPSYLLRSRHAAEDEESASIVVSSRDDDAPFSGNAVEWALRRIDRSLDEAEANPPLPAKVIWDVARGPVGSAAAKGATVAARTTVKVGGHALKAAAPVGKWALEQGFRAAVGIINQSMEASKKKSRDKR